MKRVRMVFSVLCLLLVSCRGTQTDPTRLVWWQFWTDASIKPVIQEIVHDFERLHPGVVVDLVDLTWADGHDKISIAFSSETGPDLVELGSDWIAEYASTGQLRDLTSEIDSVRSQYMLWEPGILDGRVYAFPWILGTRVLFINTELLTKAGFDPLFRPGTWTELLDATQKINALGGDIFGFGSNSAERHRLYKKFLPFLWSNGGDILTVDGAGCLLGSQQAVTALNYYLTLCRTGITDTQRRLEDAFVDGKVGFVISGDWLLKRLAADRPQMPFATTLIPGPSGLESSTSFAGGEYLAINARSTRSQLALQLIRHLCRRENQIRFCLQNRTPNPALKAAVADSLLMAQPHFDTFIQQMAVSRTSPVHRQWVYIEEHLENEIEAALYEVKTPEKACADAAREIQKLLNE